MKDRKHHNNTGYRQIKRDKCSSQLKHICHKLKLNYRDTKDFDHDKETDKESY